MNFKERTNPSTTVKTVESKRPRIGITSDALAKMFVYVSECNDEIGWLGTVQQMQNKRHYLIDDVYLFEQNVHGATTEITPEGLSKFAEELLQKPDGMEIWNNIKVWGHSHVNMGITPSGQDDKQMVEFAEVGHEWFIRLIANKKGEMKLDFFDYANGVAFHDVPWEEIVDDSVQALEKEMELLQKKLDEMKGKHVETYKEPIKTEMKEKVSKITYQSPSKYGAGYGYNSKTGNEKDPRVPAGATFWNDHGYTYKGQWVSFYSLDQADKKKGGKSKQPNKSSGVRGKTQTGRPSYSTPDTFVTDEDVMQYFTAGDLASMADATTIYTMRREVAFFGFEEDDMSDDDIRRLIRLAEFFAYQATSKDVSNYVNYTNQGGDYE